MHIAKSWRYMYACMCYAHTHRENTVHSHNHTQTHIRTDTHRHTSTQTHTHNKLECTCMQQAYCTYNTITHTHSSTPHTHQICMPYVLINILKSTSDLFLLNVKLFEVNVVQCDQGLGTVVAMGDRVTSVDIIIM